jgi:hypothetical protein
LSLDTSPEAERVLVGLLRRAEPWRKLQQLADANQTLAALALGALRLRYPTATPVELRRRLATQWLGEPLAALAHHAVVVGEGKAMQGNPTTVLLIVIDQFERLGIPYVLGGSMASAVHGTLRATLDADLVVDIKHEHVEPLVKALSGTFYIDDLMIHDAITRRASFNLIHLESMFKVDVFVLKRRRFDTMQLERRITQAISTEPARSIDVATPEDIILAKLEWYRLGNEASERQWSDVLGVLKVQAGALDLAYLRYWAADLGVSDLLERALDDAGI